MLHDYFPKLKCKFRSVAKTQIRPVRAVDVIEFAGAPIRLSWIDQSIRGQVISLELIL